MPLTLLKGGVVMIVSTIKNAADKLEINRRAEDRAMSRIFSLNTDAPLSMRPKEEIGNCTVLLELR